MNHFQTRPFTIHTNKVTYPCKMCDQLSHRTCSLNAIAEFCFEQFFYLNLYSHYIHIKEISWITVTSPQEIILVRTAQILKHLSGVTHHLNTFQPKGFLVVLHN